MASGGSVGHEIEQPGVQGEKGVVAVLRDGPGNAPGELAEVVGAEIKI